MRTIRCDVEIIEDDPDHSGETLILDDGTIAPVMGELHSGLTLADWERINAAVDAYWAAKQLRAAGKDIPTAA